MEIRWRVLLPLCHVVIDVALLAATVYAVNSFRSTLRHPWPLWRQHYGYVDRNFLRSAYGPPMVPPLQAINFGTLPASAVTGLLAETVFANGALSWKVSSPFDIPLVLLNLFTATAFWYGAGRLGETGPALWKKLAVAYLAARLLTIPTSLVLRANDPWMLCTFLYLLVWTSFAAFAGWRGLRYTLWRLRARTSQPII